MKNRGGRSNVNAPLYVALRDAERRILRETLEHAGGNESRAADMLGVTHTLVWQRVRALGGIYPDDPRREPFDHKVAAAAVKEKRAERRNKRASTRKSHPGESKTTAPSNGATDGVHDEQDRLEGEPVAIES